MSCTPLTEAAKPVWAKQLTRLPCLVVYAKFQFVYTIETCLMRAGHAGYEKVRKGMCGFAELAGRPLVRPGH